jgi:uncharacterized protein
MEIYEAILHLLEESGGRIASKTKIHKEMFFLSKILGDDFGFRPHYYGPYSPKVEESLDALSGANFIQVLENSYGVAGERGFEVMRYDYSLTESGKRLLRQIGNATRQSEIHDFVISLQNIGDPDYMDLSIAAKVLYIIEQNDKARSIVEIENTARDFGWSLKDEDISKAAETLRALGFVR